jgi:acyl carrier protein
MEISAVITTYLQEEALGGRSDITLTPTTRLVEEEILDSLGIFSMVSFLEERFSLSIDPEDVTIEHFATITDIEAFVASKQAAGASQP